jgi:hypothetical protein
MSIPSMVRGSDHVDPRCTSPAVAQSTIAPRGRATTTLPRRVAIAETRRPDPPNPALHNLKRRLASPAAREPEDVLTISRPACRSRLQAAQSRSRSAASDRIVLAIVGVTSFANPGRRCTAQKRHLAPSVGRRELVRLLRPNRAGDSRLLSGQFASLKAANPPSRR